MASVILDHRGEPIRKAALLEELTGPTITGVRSVWSTHHVRNLTPARMASILRRSETPGQGAAADYVELAEAMEERDLHYLGTLQTRKRQVAQIGVTIEPASDGGDDVRDAELVREFFDRDDIEDEMVDLLDALAKGYSVAEIMWETSERQWMPLRLEWRLPQWFDFDRVSGRRLMRRDERMGWIQLEPYKYVAHTAAVKSGLPIRGGLARIVAWAWMFKSYSLRDWVRFVETYGQPLRLGKYDRSSTPEDRAVLYKAVREIGADMAAIVPEEMGIEFPGELVAQGRSELYMDLIKYIDSQISIAVLGQTLTTEAGNTGSYALGQVHNLVRSDIERSDARQLAATLHRDLVIPIVALNHGPRKRYPAVSIRREEDGIGADILSQVLERLVPLGLRVGVSDVRARLGLAAPDDADDVLEAPRGEGPAIARDTGGSGPRARAAADTAANPRVTAVQTERLRRDALPLTDDIIDHIRERVEHGTAETLDALAAELAEMLPDVDRDDLAVLLGEAMMAAELAGRYDVMDGG